MSKETFDFSEAYNRLKQGRHVRIVGQRNTAEWSLSPDGSTIIYGHINGINYTFFLSPFKELEDKEWEECYLLFLEKHKRCYVSKEQFDAYNSYQEKVKKEYEQYKQETI